MPEEAWEEADTIYLKVSQGTDGDHHSEKLGGVRTVGIYASTDKGKTFEFIREAYLRTWSEVLHRPYPSFGLAWSIFLWLQMLIGKVLSKVPDHLGIHSAGDWACGMWHSVTQCYSWYYNDVVIVLHMGLTSIEYKTDVEPRKQEIIDFCKRI